MMPELVLEFGRKIWRPDIELSAGESIFLSHYMPSKCKSAKSSKSLIIKVVLLFKIHLFDRAANPRILMKKKAGIPC